MTRFFVGLALLTLLTTWGCGGTPRKMDSRAIESKKDAEPAVTSADAFQPVNADEPGGKDVPPADKVKRKIKYVADFRLITEDFPRTEDALMDLIVANDGFLSFADVATSPGQPRTATWRARVPIAKFESFRKSIAKIAEVERANINSEDVTSQFSDLEYHIKNQKAQEEALRELLKRQTDRMDNLLTVQRELSTVRNSIERSEGQLRLLANLTDLTTITIHVQERRKYAPNKGPEQAEKPTFTTRVSHTFGENWLAFSEFVQNGVIAIVAVTPWLPLIAVLTISGMFVYRRLRTVFKSRKGSIVEIPALLPVSEVK